jgi:hypothetical protein
MTTWHEELFYWAGVLVVCAAIFVFNQANPCPELLYRMMI